jgi:hypothetical protein
VKPYKALGCKLWRLREKVSEKYSGINVMLLIAFVPFLTFAEEKPTKHKELIHGDD